MTRPATPAAWVAAAAGGPTLLGFAKAATPAGSKVSVTIRGAVTDLSGIRTGECGQCGPGFKLACFTQYLGLDLKVAAFFHGCVAAVWVLQA